MARGKLWSVKGVSTEAREAAKAAAQNSDQPIGVWIDQAILMSGDDIPENKSTEETSADDVSELDIVTILQALEERVANHADRITEQLGPVRDSISELGDRLQSLEEKQQDLSTTQTSGTQSDLHPTPPEPVKQEQPEPPVAPPAEPEHEPNFEQPAPDPVSEESNIGKAAEAPAGTPEPPRRIDPGNVTEADIHAADAALKSELTGLFDDGAHRSNAALHTKPNDPFMPRRPQRRSSKAPLVFVSAILLAALVGIGAVAWFEFLSPEMRTSLTSGLLSKIEGSETADTTQAPKPEPTATPAPAAPTPQAPATPEPAPVQPSANTPTTPPTAAEDAATSLAAEPEPGLDTAEAATAIARKSSGNAELDALREDAATGVATAQNELGVRYLVGRGVAQDYGEAAFWLRKAAAQDMTNAQYNLGVLYESGRGVEADPTEALIWFHSAAENGHGRAQMAVAAAYASGRGITRNPDEALKWLRRAAESNVAEAQFSLGNVLSTSPASRESLIDAFYWYRIADGNGVAKASERSDQIAAQLTPEERAGVNARVSHFIAQKIPRPPKSPASNVVPAPASTPAEKPESAPSNNPKPAVSPARAEQSLSQDQINALQTLLNQLGFETGTPDGKMGAKTRDAIRNYQRELGLTVNGEPSLELLNHMRQIAGER